MHGPIDEGAGIRRREAQIETRTRRRRVLCQRPPRHPPRSDAHPVPVNESAWRCRSRGENGTLRPAHPQQGSWRSRHQGPPLVTLPGGLDAGGLGFAQHGRHPVGIRGGGGSVLGVRRACENGGAASEAPSPSASRRLEPERGWIGRGEGRHNHDRVIARYQPSVCATAKAASKSAAGTRAPPVWPVGERSFSLANRKIEFGNERSILTCYRAAALGGRSTIVGQYDALRRAWRNW